MSTPRDLSDVIYNISPDGTPLIEWLKRPPSKTTLPHNWHEDRLTPRSDTFYFSYRAQLQADIDNWLRPIRSNP